MSSPGFTERGLSWNQWLRGWSSLIHEVLTQRITTRHLKAPMPLPPLHNTTSIVTGSTSGIGLQIAHQLAQSGSHVVMAVRNPKAAHSLIKEWQDLRGAGASSAPLKFEVMELDLLSFESVVRFSEAWNSQSRPLNLLINNAGIFSIGQPQKFSHDGNETHIQTNHLGPSLLSLLLLPSLNKCKSSRIVNVNSVMHLLGFVDPNDMNFASGKTKFTSFRAYCNSKLAQVMFWGSFQRRAPGISVACVAPGSCKTNVARDLPRVLRFLYRLIPFFLFRAEEGSRSALFAATDSGISDYCGKVKREEWPHCAYVSYECRPMRPSEEAERRGECDKVWERTLEMIGLPPDALELLLEGKEVKCRFGGHQF